MKEPPKIFIGLINIASMLGDFKSAFADLGQETITAVFIKHVNIIQTTGVDYIIDQHPISKILYRIPYRIRSKIEFFLSAKKFVFRKAIRECDTFIFLWSSFEPDFSDFKLLKKLGKKIICVHVGDDVRWYYAMKQEFEKYGLPLPHYDPIYKINSFDNFKKKLGTLRMAEKYADWIFSRLDQAQLAIKPYYRWNMMVDTNVIPHQPIQRQFRPIVLHAPTHREFKGTDYVFEVIKKLKNEKIDFEFLLIENVSNLEAIEMYKNGDILIDQLLCPGSGKLATEALAAGKVVLSNMSYDKYPQNNHPDYPIIDVNPENLYEVLKELIINYEKRSLIASKSRKFVEEHLDVKFFCKKVLQLINGEVIPYDYSPSFFRNQFIPESEEALMIYNQWNDSIKDCEWYKQSIKNGNRDGLIF